MMTPFDRYLNGLISENLQTFGSWNLKWVNPYEASAYEDQRSLLTENIDRHGQWSFKRTKPWVNRLSPGCGICGQGNWSCLFLTGICNARCFYCPTAQLQDHLPATQLFHFSDPAAYAAYLNRFGFTGCSFSGGEPFLVYDRLLRFLARVRKDCSPDLYIWMYTNGLLGSAERYRELADLGLNEVRFDLGATGYRLDGLEQAAGVIPNLTVEIPAVPEEEERLMKLLPRLTELGVGYLNLHSLRLTPHNAAQLTKRSYTYLHGEQVVVLESELTALRVMDHVIRENSGIGVNYCSAQYKRRFQRTGFRRRIATVLNPGDYVTEAGYILRLSAIDGASRPVSDLLAGRLSGEGSVIQVFAYDFEDQGPDVQVPVLRMARSPFAFEADEQAELIRLLDGHDPFIPEDRKLFDLWKYVRIEEGMRPYF